MRDISALDDLLGLSEEGPVMLLKHSTRCPISTLAHGEFERYAASAGERGVVCARVLVVEQRSLSLQIAEALGVRHESPQAILVRERAAVWSASHDGVTAESLREAEEAELAGTGD